MQKIDKNIAVTKPKVGSLYVAETKPSHERNLHFAEKLSVVALKSVLAGAQNCFIPTVSAAAKDETPKRPPPMKYKDLPIYECPHLRYHEFENDKNYSCPEENRKIIHEYLQPTVTEYRKQIASTINDLRTEISDTVKEVTEDFYSARAKLLTKMRDPKNADSSMLLLTASGLAGLRLGKSIPRKLFLSGLGLFVTGSMCFPQETDQKARTFLYMLGKAFVPLYNFYFGTDWVMRERVPCERDVPKIPLPTKPLPACNPKK